MNDVKFFTVNLQDVYKFSLAKIVLDDFTTLGKCTIGPIAVTLAYLAGVLTMIVLVPLFPILYIINEFQVSEVGYNMRKKWDAFVKLFYKN